MMDTCDKIHQAADAFADLAASDKDKQGLPSTATPPASAAEPTTC